MEGKTAIVTGGVTGIGRGVVDQLLDTGCTVLIIDISGELGLKERDTIIKKGIDPNRIFFMQCDLTDVERFRKVFKQAVEKLGGIDFVVSNAGRFHEGDWQKMVDLNFTAAIRCTYLAMNYMSKTRPGGRGGVIINTISITGIDPSYGSPVYTSTKHGLAGFTQSFAAIPGFFEKHGIRVVGVCPGCVDTPLWDGVESQQGLRPTNAQPDDFVGLPEMRDFFPGMVKTVKPSFFTVDKIAEVYRKIFQSDGYHGKLVCLPDGYTEFVVFEKQTSFVPFN